MGFATCKAAIMPPPPSVGLENHSSFSSPPCQSVSGAFCGPKMLKEPLFGDSNCLPPSLLAPRVLLWPEPAPWSSFPLWQAVEVLAHSGFLCNHATIYFIPWRFLYSGGGSVHAAHFLPPPNDKPTHPFCFVGFTENHQGEKEKVTKNPHGRDVTVLELT